MEVYIGAQSEYKYRVHALLLSTSSYCVDKRLLLLLVTTSDTAVGAACDWFNAGNYEVLQ